jgi:hypothetical protein
VGNFVLILETSLDSNHLIYLNLMSILGGSMPLALYTFGLFSKPADDPANAGFHELSDIVLQAVDGAQGLIARSGYASDGEGTSWGPEIYPSFYRERGDGWSPATLSLWRDLESLFFFTYFGIHAAVLKRGREWFEAPDWPPLVLWWHQKEGNPTWADGVARHAELHAQGPRPGAFDFKQAFDQRGDPVRLDKGRISLFRHSAPLR